MIDKGYIYLASPYTDPDPLIREIRYLAAASALRTMLRNNIWTYSPIVHCHHLSQIWKMPHDAAFWLEYDQTMIRGARSVTVLCLPGWQRSVGVKGEIEYSLSLGKQISYLQSSGDPIVETSLGRYQDIPESAAAAVRPGTATGTGDEH